MSEIASGLYALPFRTLNAMSPKCPSPKCHPKCHARIGLGDQVLFSLALLLLASISEQVYDVFAVMLLWGGQPLW